MLELTPTGKYNLSLLLSTGIHGNETAPVEIVELLLRALYRAEITLHCRLLVVLGNPPALAQNKRYLVSDINRMFGGRWAQFPQSDETTRAQWLEKVVTAFCRGGETRWHLDLHTAIRASYHVRFGVLPQRHQPWDEAFLTGLATRGWRRWFSTRRRGTFTHFTCENVGALSCTGARKALPFGQNDLTRFAPTHQALRALLAGLRRNPPGNPLCAIGSCSRSRVKARLSSFIWHPIR